MNAVELRKERTNLEALKARHDLAAASVARERKALRDAKVEVADLGEAGKVFQEAAKLCQEQAHGRIAAVVDRCLKAVFGDSYGFRINFEKRRGRTEAELLLTKDGKDMDVLGSSGGGVADVCAFALRLACLLLSRPAKRRLLVLDEPFRFVSREYRPAMRDLILMLAKEMKVQIVLVTHDPVFEIGKVVELEGG